MDPLNFISVEEACKRLNVSRSTLYRMLKRQEIASAIVGVRHRVVSAQSLNQYMAERIAA